MRSRKLKYDPFTVAGMNVDPVSVDLQHEIIDGDNTWVTIKGVVISVIWKCRFCAHVDHRVCTFCPECGKAKDGTSYKVPDHWKPVSLTFLVAIVGLLTALRCFDR